MGDAQAAERSRIAEIAIDEHRQETSGNTMKSATLVMLLPAIRGCGQPGAESMLSPGQSLSGELAAGEHEEFVIDLESNSFIYA